MIKKWNQFNESVVPGPNEDGTISVRLSEEDAELFSEEPALQKLVADQKVALFDNEVWYWEGDGSTANILKQYINNPVGESKVNENSTYTGDKETAYKIANHLCEEGWGKGMSKEEFEELWSRFSTQTPKESYRDKMKRKVADAAKSIESGKRNYRP